MSSILSKNYSIRMWSIDLYKIIPSVFKSLKLIRYIKYYRALASLVTMFLSTLFAVRLLLSPKINFSLIGVSFWEHLFSELTYAYVLELNIRYLLRLSIQRKGFIVYSSRFEWDQWLVSNSSMIFSWILASGAVLKLRRPPPKWIKWMLL